MAMVMCMNQQINPTLLLDQQVIKAKIPLFNKALFKNGIEESSFIGREVMKVSFENDLYGRCYEGNAYAFCENNVTFLFIELWLKGNSSEFLSMWNIQTLEKRLVNTLVRLRILSKVIKLMITSMRKTLF